jgi:hypothetical protein
MSAEEYFDSIYTYHVNDFVRMPLNELYELMEGYHKSKSQESDSLTCVSKSLPCGDCENYAEYDGSLKICSNCGTNL